MELLQRGFLEGTSRRALILSLIDGAKLLFNTSMSTQEVLHSNLWAV